MFCKNCGKEINGSFCPWCGTKVDIVETKKESVYIENKNKIKKENKIDNKKTKKSKTKIFLVCGMIVFALTIISVVFLSYFNIINIPALFSQQSPAEETIPANTVVFDENNVGEIYFYQTEAENIVTNTEGFMYVDNEILLVANDEATYADIKKLAKNYEAEIVGWIEQTGDYQLQLNQTYTYAELEKIVTSLKNENIIQDAYINFAFETNVNKTEERNGFIYGDEWEKDLQNFNNSQGKSWGIEAIESLAAWDVLDANKKNVNPIKVGLIDCGFDTTHEDLGFAETFYNNVTRLDHGTHVAGTMAAKANNQEGVCGVYPYGDGNLYGVSFDGMKTYSENTTTSMCLKIAYSELILRNVKVINTSWGFQYKEAGLKYTEPEWKEQVDFLESNAYILGDFLNRLLDKGYDFVLVTSAGNNSDRKNNIVYDSKYNYWTAVISEEDYPKVHNRIIVVGAVDSNFEICNFSDGGDRVDIYAPGDTIFSTIPNNKYENKDWSGTSMAAPHVSGVAAMVWSVNNNLTGAQVKEIICSSHSFRCNTCDMIDAYIALQKAARLKTDESNDNTEYGGILCWVVSAKNVNTKVQNATVILTSQQSGEEFITTTDAFGHFEFFVPAGKYSLSVKAEDYEDYFSPGDYFIIVENNSINYLSDWIKIEPKYSNEDVLGTYKGSYFVNQEEIGLTLTVYDEGARYKATFDFYNLPGKSNTESGKYYMDVSYNISTDEYYFVATDWINQPTDYSTLDLEGKLVGNILSSESPTKFSVTKVTEDDALSKLLGTYKGSYFANQGETGLTLTVYKEDKEYKALFDFYNLPGKNNAKSGKYYMDVSYDIFTDEYTFTATEWIEQPSGYYLLDLKGKLADNTLSGESPTKFSVSKTTKDETLTNEDAKILWETANKVYCTWVNYFEQMQYIDKQDCVVLPNDDLGDITYYRVKHNNINSVQSLKGYLQNYFSENVCNDIISFYKDYNGNLYYSEHGYGTENSAYGEITIKNQANSTATIIVQFIDSMSETTFEVEHNLTIENDKWVFADFVPCYIYDINNNKPEEDKNTNIPTHISTDIKNKIIQVCEQKYADLDGTLVIFDSEISETDEHFLVVVRIQRNNANSGANQLFADVKIEKSTGKMYINNEYVETLW